MAGIEQANLLTPDNKSKKGRSLDDSGLFIMLYELCGSIREKKG